jgi:hypothetical protein
MKVTNITAEVKAGDGVRTYPDFAEVAITLEGHDEPIIFVIHQSRLYRDAINVEIDGMFAADDPALRINLNDNLILDTVEGVEALPDSRPTDMDDELDDDELPWAVGDHKDEKVGEQYPIIGRFGTLPEAEEWVGTLPEVETGRYSIAGPSEDE